MSSALDGFSRLPPSLQQAILRSSAMPPPPGVVPDFDSPPDNDATGYGVMSAFMGLAIVVVATHLYTRLRFDRKFYMEDVAAVCALVAFIVFTSYTYRGAHEIGFHIHQWNVRLEDMPGWLYAVSAALVSYAFCVMLVKVGILLQWIRIFVPRGRRDAFWWTCQVTIVVNVVFYVVVAFLEIFECRPRSKKWYPWIEGTCHDSKTLIFSSFLNFFSDVIILLLPQWTIWHLKMSTAKKICTGALFLIGIGSIIAAALRINYSFDFDRSRDKTWHVSGLAYSCAAEMAVGFCVLCLPSLPKLVKDTPWIHRALGVVRSLVSWSYRSKESTRDSGKEKRFNESWPRARRTPRTPDESLLTETQLSTLDSDGREPLNDERGIVKSVETTVAFEPVSPAESLDDHMPTRPLGTHNRVSQQSVARSF